MSWSWTWLTRPEMCIGDLSENIIEYVTKLVKYSRQQYHFKYYTIFAGLLPTRWTTYRSSQLTDEEVLVHKSTTWSSQFSFWMTKQGHEAWLLRNQQIHKDKSTSTMNDILNQKISQLYHLQNEIGYHDRDLFQIPLDERYKLSERQKVAWIEHTTKTMKVSMEDYVQKQKTGQRDIRQFFGQKHDLKEN